MFIPDLYNKFCFPAMAPGQRRSKRQRGIAPEVDSDEGGQVGPVAGPSVQQGSPVAGPAAQQGSPVAGPSGTPGSPVAGPSRTRRIPVAGPSTQSSSDGSDSPVPGPSGVGAHGPSR